MTLSYIRTAIRFAAGALGETINRAAPAKVASRAQAAANSWSDVNSGRMECDGPDATHGWDALIRPAATLPPSPPAAGPNFTDVYAVVVDNMRGHYRQLERPGHREFLCICGLRDLSASQHFDHTAEIITSALVFTFEVRNR